MKKQRLEAFSDGVIAILITIMVLELKAPEGSTLTALRPLVPTLLAYVLSFVYLGIYWNNHHHLLQAATSVSGGVLWANLHLLFWLSLVPFATSWVGRNPVAVPTALYGMVLLLAGVAYSILLTVIIRHEGRDSPMARVVGGDFKGKLSLAMCAAGIVLSFLRPWLGEAMYVAVAATWFVPDRRMERAAAMD